MKRTVKLLYGSLASLLLMAILLFFGWRNHQLAAYHNALQQTVYYIDGQAMSDFNAILSRNQHRFINISYIESYMPQGFRLAASKRRVLFGPQSLSDAAMDSQTKNLIQFSDFEINLPVVRRADDYFIDMHYLPYFAEIAVFNSTKPQLYTKDFAYHYSFTLKETPLKVAPSLFSAEVTRLRENTRVNVIDIGKTHLKVISEAGQNGYISRRDIDKIYLAQPATFPKQSQKYPNRYGKIQLTFDFFSDYPSMLEVTMAEKIAGLDVLVPTVFKLTDDGWVLNNLDPHYVSRAHALGYRVHALFDNQFDPAKTHDMLNDEQLSARVIDQIEYYARYYDLDGLNLDFENVLLADRSAYSKFVYKLSERLQRIGLVVSVDATRPGGSDNWSKFLDRYALGQVVDYIVFMAYDEHWSSSPVAGSVASKPWVDQGIRMMLNEVPKNKLILAVPTYMRVWRESGPPSAPEVTPSALAMNQLENFLKQYDVYSEYDDATGQTYYEMRTQSGETIKIWAEDAVSLDFRLELLQHYDLSGIASWRKGLESDSFWSTVAEALEEM